MIGEYGQKTGMHDERQMSISPSPVRMQYLAPLDGIRALAILGVLLYHVSPSTLRGGFTGVDVFFVLSGFLITSIILHDLREGNFSIREFYVRRIQRLLPNVVVTVLAVVFLWSILLPPSTARATGSHGLWTLFNLSNIYIWRNLGGYWGDAAEWAPLTHTWSLGIEEQFYLIFPGSLLLLARFHPSRVRTWLTVATILSFGISLYGTHARPVATFYLLPTRVWELLLGAVLAAHRTPLRVAPGQLWNSVGMKTRQVMGWAGLGIVVLGFFTIDAAKGFPGWVSLGPTVGTALLLLSVANGETTVSRLLSIPFMSATGKFSYSLYLWHWPLIILGKTQADLYGLPQIGGAIAGGLGGILLGWMAYVCVERPLRDRGPGRAWRLATIAGGFVIVALGCGVVASRRAVADPANHFDTPAFYGRSFNAGRNGDFDPAAVTRYYDVYFPPLGLRPDDAWRTGGIVNLYGGGRPKIVVLGSSHALMYSKLIDDICREMGLSVAFLGVDEGAPAFFETTINPSFSSPREAREFDEARRKWLREWRPEAVFAIDRWDIRSEDFEVKLRAFLRDVSPLAGRVIFVAQVPVAAGGDQINLRELITYRMGKVKGLPRLNPDSREHLRKQAAATAETAMADFQNLRVLRADLSFYQEDGSIRYASGRSFLYADNDHLSQAGAEMVRGLIRGAIVEAHTVATSP